ncbi:hypothetical protein ACFE04_029661 [Oxalis oulophora]
MFLVCNALLTLVATSFVLSSSSGETQTKGLDDEVFVDCTMVGLENIVALGANEEEKENESDKDVVVEVLRVSEDKEVDQDIEKEEDVVVEVLKDSDDGRQGKEGNDVNVVYSRQQMELEGQLEANDQRELERLNRKIEEFIRKMKEEIKIEAQRHLVVV